MTTILQLSDTHIVAEGVLVSGRLATDAALIRLVDHLTGSLDKIGPVDALLVSGDLSDDGSDESYQRFLTMIEPLGMPGFVIPGNHDRREAMRRAFSGPGYLPKTGKLNWHQSVGSIDLIGIDTLVEGSGAGELDEGTLEFLTTALRTAGTRPVLLAMHHPPFSSGVAFLDDIGLAGTDALARILLEHSGEVHLVCGHIHSTMVASIGGKIAISSPSPCSSFAFDARPEAAAGFCDQGDGCLLHRWRGGFQTVRIGQMSGDGPFAF